MKKVVLLSGLLAFSAQADDAVTSGKDAYAGFYAGIGLCYMHSHDKLEIIDGQIGRSIPVTKIHDKKGHHFGGSIIGGYGGFVYGNVYLGGELLFDVTQNKNTEGTYEVYGLGIAYRSKVNGFVPSIAIRIGGWCCPINAMVYIKGGIALVQAEYQEKDPALNADKRKLSKITPVIGLGIEKNVYNNLNVRFEGDYKFPVKKTTKTVDLTSNNTIWWKVRDRLDSFSLRLIATYKF